MTTRPPPPTTPASTTPAPSAHDTLVAKLASDQKTLNADVASYAKTQDVQTAQKIAGDTATISQDQFALAKEDVKAHVADIQAAHDALVAKVAQDQKTLNADIASADKDTHNVNAGNNVGHDRMQLAADQSALAKEEKADGLEPKSTDPTTPKTTDPTSPAPSAHDQLVAKIAGEQTTLDTDIAAYNKNTHDKPLEDKIRAEQKVLDTDKTTLATEDAPATPASPDPKAAEQSAHDTLVAKLASDQKTLNADVASYAKTQDVQTAQKIAGDTATISQDQFALAKEDVKAHVADIQAAHDALVAKVAQDQKTLTADIASSEKNTHDVNAGNNVSHDRMQLAADQSALAKEEKADGFEPKSTDPTTPKVTDPTPPAPSAHDQLVAKIAGEQTTLDTDIAAYNKNTHDKPLEDKIRAEQKVLDTDKKTLDTEDAAAAPTSAHDKLVATVANAQKTLDADIAIQTNNPHDQTIDAKINIDRIILTADQKALSKDETNSATASS